MSIQHHRYPCISTYFVPIGGAVATAPDPAPRALYDGLLDTCERAIAEHARVAAAAGEGAKVPEAVLDFFGVSVKADEMHKHVLQFQHLIDKLSAMEDDRQFRIDGSIGAVSMGKWGKACAWTARDDAMLLVGTVRHGFGNFEAMAADAELGLAEKMVNAIPGAKEAGMPDYPKSACRPVSPNYWTGCLTAFCRILCVDGQGCVKCMLTLQ